MRSKSRSIIYVRIKICASADFPLARLRILSFNCLDVFNHLKKHLQIRFEYCTYIQSIRILHQRSKILSLSFYVRV